MIVAHVYMDAKIRMSQKAMANFMYAVIMTNCSIVTSYGVGIYEYNRKQNSYNNVDIKVLIPYTKIKEFQELSGCKLNKPISVALNNA